MSPLQPGQLVVAMETISPGFYDEVPVPQGSTGTLLEIGGYFDDQCRVQWDNGVQCHVIEDILVPAYKILKGNL